MKQPKTKKIKGPNHPGPPRDHIIKELNDKYCRILPATFDFFGKLGPAITDFLYIPNNEFKTFERNTETLHPHAKQAIKITTDKYRAHSLLACTNTDWNTKNGNILVHYILQSQDTLYVGQTISLH